MENIFKKKPFFERLKDTGFLIKHTFTIVGKDEDIKKPTIHMIILSLIMIFLTFSAILLFFLGQFILVGIGMLLFVILILFPFQFFYNVRQKADQSWIVFNTITGKDISYRDAHKHTREEKGKLRIIALIDLVMNYVLASQRGKKGVMGFIIQLVFAALNEIWDLLSHYMIPAVVIEQKPIKELVGQIKALKTNVPATLAGVFGIDFVGHVIGTVFNSLFTLFLFLSVGVGYAVAQVTDVTVITIDTFAFSWVPVFAILFIITIFNSVYRNIVESVKVIYFTIFYTSIMHPMNIVPSMKDELTNYLLMKESDFAPHQEPSPHEKFIAQLSAYIKQYQGQGYQIQQIESFLLSKGYKQEDINEAKSRP